MFETIYQPIVEFGFSIKQSKFFVYYTGFVVLLALTLIFMMIRKIQIKIAFAREVKNPRKTYYNEKIPVRDYERVKSQLTRSQLRKLQQSKQYKQHLKQKLNPTSVYNMSRIDAITSDIQFSDEEQSHEA